MTTTKETIKECRCAKCQIKKRASDIYANIKEFMRKEVEQHKDIESWEITDIIRIAQTSRPFYFVRMQAKSSHEMACNCQGCGGKGQAWTTMTCVIQESQLRYDLNLLPFVDILDEVKEQSKESRKP
jgi:hypothetical protein